MAGSQLRHRGAAGAAGQSWSNYCYNMLLCVVQQLPTGLRCIRIMYICRRLTCISMKCITGSAWYSTPGNSEHAVSFVLAADSRPMCCRLPRCLLTSHHPPK